jgi:hypothetical protein
MERLKYICRSPSCLDDNLAYKCASLFKNKGMAVLSWQYDHYISGDGKATETWDSTTVT